jgi:hypothetical protein
VFSPGQDLASVSVTPSDQPAHCSVATDVTGPRAVCHLWFPFEGDILVRNHTKEQVSNVPF